MGAENVDPYSKRLKRTFNYNNTRMINSMAIFGFTASALDSIYVADRLTLRTKYV